MAGIYRQCTRCVMDTSDPEIRFDSAGHCNHCTTQIDKLRQLRAAGRYGSEYLPDVLDKIRSGGAGRRYDAILGISGGADSCYLALRLRKLGLRLLLVHVDNGWDSSTAVANIRAAAEALDLDYESVVLDWDEFREIQLAFLKASVVEAETPTDLAIAGAIHRVAARTGVRTIVSASNEASEGILPRLWHYDAKDMRYFNSINKTYGHGRARNFPDFGLGKEIYYKFVRGIRIFYPLNFMNYNPAESRSSLEKEIGWRNYGGKHHESHYTRFVQSYLLPEKFELDYRRATLSSLICAGQASREQALRVLDSPPFRPEEVALQKRYIATKLRISLEELDEIIERRGRYFFEFPNRARSLGLAYRLYNRFTRPRAGISAFSRTSPSTAAALPRER